MKRENLKPIFQNWPMPLLLLFWLLVALPGHTLYCTWLGIRNGLSDAIRELRELIS
jgi:hypothetical protein